MTTTTPADYTTDATYLSLLAGALAEPADDNPRLVLAGWLEENGQEERAEFIRAQCELARLPTCRRVRRGGEPTRNHAATCRHCELRIALLDAFDLDTQQVWFATPSGTFIPPGGVRRGFVSEIRLSPADWFTHHQSLYWQPGDTVECPEREGSGMACHIVRPDGEEETCMNCAGKGRIPRPVPYTAQPLELVRLTEIPTAHVPEFNALHCWKRPLEWGGDVRDSLAAEWPRIRFLLSGDEE